VSSDELLEDSFSKPDRLGKAFENSREVFEIVNI
jgi:hypothetical protein